MLATYGAIKSNASESPVPSPERSGTIRKLSLPNMLAAAARYGFGRLLLGQLRFADGAGFSHHVSHDLYSLAESLDGVSGFHV